MDRAGDHDERQDDEDRAHRRPERVGKNHVLATERDAEHESDNREPLERRRDRIFRRAAIVDYRQDGEKADRQGQLGEKSARWRDIDRTVRVAAVGHRNLLGSLPVTPALAKVAILWNRSSADSITFIANAVPVPSPNRKSRSSIGRTLKKSSASAWPPSA